MFVHFKECHGNHRNLRTVTFNYTMQHTNSTQSIKVPITPKSFFPLTKSLHLFETHCAFLPLFNPNIDLLQAVKVTKSGHHLPHDRRSKGYGSIPCLTSQTSLHACLQRLIRCKSVCDIKQGIDPCPLLARSRER